MQARQRGMSTAGIIAVIVVLVVVGGAAAYFLSDPFRTKTDAAYTQFSKWTPENIAKDPVNYLNFAEAETKAAMLKLDASKISVGTKRVQFESSLEDAAKKVSVGDKALAELKDLYKKAAADGSWPVKWQGSDRKEDDIKRQIMSLHNQTQSQRKLKDKLARGIEMLSAQLNTIDEQKSKCANQLNEIMANREILKVQQISDDLKNQLVELRGTLQATVAAVDTTEGGDVSLDQLTQQAATTVDESEFAKILNQ